MNIKNSTEKIKPFRLVKYFAFISLILIFISLLILSVLNAHWAKKLEVKKSEEYALLLAENLNHQIFLKFLIPVTLKYGKIQLRNMEQFERMDMVVRSTLHSFKVEMVNIYDMTNTISYSFDKKIIGKNNAGGTGYYNAVSGISNSRLVQNGNFLEILLGFPKKSMIVTLVPLRAEKPLSGISGPVLGVVEIFQDVTEDYKQIFKFQLLIIIAYFVVMSVLFSVLVFVVKRGEGIIQKRALDEIKLKEKLNRAERLSSLGSMVAGISHEIRNPLGVIRSSAELLKKKMAVFEPSSFIPDIIIEESSRLNSIVTDFLNYAKPREPDLTLCNVNEIIAKNIKYLSTQIKKHKYLFEVDCPEKSSEIMADSSMLYQAFLNIFLNAMQAMPSGGKIKIKMEIKEDAVKVFVDDQGTGIPENLLKKIWNPFFTTKDTGTGLGLGIVKNIIEAHEGSVTIANIHKYGARVSVELPIKMEA